jgi:lysine-N-methylase
MPEYCKNFRCIASKCQDNCCIGWEIDIDSSSAEYYESVKGSFGDKLRSNIIKSDVCSFKLCGERCPFLNENNLCEIIINLGEDKLCQICGDHPRFFEWYSDIKEGGIGLCCEEAARIIVPNKEPFDTYDLPCDDEGCNDYDENLYNMLTFAREEIIKALEDSSESLKIRLYSIMCYALELQYMADNYQFDKKPFAVQYPAEETTVNLKAFLRCFTSLEPIDESWEKYLSDLLDNSEILQEKLSAYKTDFDLYLKNIAVYFIWRYFLKGVYDEEFLSKTILAVISCAVIKLMYINEASQGEDLTEEKLSLIAKRYSKEIEYSQENLDKIYDMVYENTSLSIKSILSLL